MEKPGFILSPRLIGTTTLRYDPELLDYFPDWYWYLAIRLILILLIIDIDTILILAFTADTSAGTYWCWYLLGVVELWEFYTHRNTDNTIHAQTQTQPTRTHARTLNTHIQIPIETDSCNIGTDSCDIGTDSCNIGTDSCDIGTDSCNIWTDSCTGTNTTTHAHARTRTYTHDTPVQQSSELFQEGLSHSDPCGPRDWPDWWDWGYQSSLFFSIVILPSSQQLPKSHDQNCQQLPNNQKHQ